MACSCSNGRGAMDDASVEMLFSLAKQTPNAAGEMSLYSVDDPFLNALVDIIADKAQYLNETGLEYLIMRLRQRYVERVPDMGLSSNDFTDSLKEKLEELPDNKTLQDKLNSINSAEWTVVDRLPDTGKPGTIYLVPLSTTQTNNGYAEYIFIKATQQWELLGVFGITGSGLVTEIGVNTKTYKPNVNGRTVLDPMVVEIIFNNHAFNVDAHGRIDLGDVGSLGGISSIVIGSETFTPDSNGMIDLSKFDFAGLNSAVKKIKFNGTTYSPNASGIVTFDYSVDLSGYMPKSGGTFTGNVRFQTGGSTYGSVINMGDGDYVHFKEDTDDHLEIYADKGINLKTGNKYTVSINGTALDTYISNLIDGAIPDTPDLSGYAKKITMNGTTYSPNTSGIIALGGVAIKATMNGSTYSVSTAGTIALGGVCVKIKLNGSTYSVNTSGQIDLGTIESGGSANAIHTGTTAPSASLGSDGDFYYKMK